MRVLYVSFVVIVLDQLTKFLVKGLNIGWLGIHLQGMPYGTSRRFVGELVRITFIENPGMAFGLDVGLRMILISFTIIAAIIILYYLYKHRSDSVLLRLALAFIFAGAMGNLIDRSFYGLIYGYAPVFYGKVVDFVQVEFWDFTFLGHTYTTWPIFNVADLSVTMGFLIILVFNKKIFRSHVEEKTEVIAEENTIANNNDVHNPDVIDNKTTGIAPLRIEDSK